MNTAEHLAKVLFHWELKRHGLFKQWYWYDETGPVMHKESWDPRHNYRQAVLCLHQLKHKYDIRLRSLRNEEAQWGAILTPIELSRSPRDYRVIGNDLSAVIADVCASTLNGET